MPEWSRGWDTNELAKCWWKSGKMYSQQIWREKASVQMFLTHASPKTISMFNFLRKCTGTPFLSFRPELGCECGEGWWQREGGFCALSALCINSEDRIWTFSHWNPDFRTKSQFLMTQRAFAISKGCLWQRKVQSVVGIAFNLIFAGFAMNYSWDSEWSTAMQGAHSFSCPDQISDITRRDYEREFFVALFIRIFLSSPDDCFRDDHWEKIIRNFSNAKHEQLILSHGNLWLFYSHL